MQLLPVTVAGDTVSVGGRPILDACEFQHSRQQENATILGWRSSGPTSLHNATVGQVSAPSRLAAHATPLFLGSRAGLSCKRSAGRRRLQS